MQVMPFEFQNKAVRVVSGEDGESRFVAPDICEALAIGNSRMALDRLDDDEKGVSSIDTLGGPQEMTVVNESGLYSLILGSRKPQAKAFKRWVTHEVLPSIRRTGRYESPGAGAQPVEPKRQIAQGDWMDQAMRNAEGLIHLALSTMDPATAARRMPGLSRPEVAMGLAGILLRTQRFLLEFDDIEHPSLRLLHPKEKIVSTHGDGWAERFVATLDRDQLKQLMQAAVQRLA